MSTPSIKVGQGNWGIKAGNLLGYANTEKKFSPVEFTSSRASNTATRVNASGNIAIVNANIPRIDYFGGQASLLVEPSGTNTWLYSEPASATGYTALNVSFVTENLAGTVNAVLLLDSTVNRSLQQSIGNKQGQTWTMFFYVKVGAGVLPNQTGDTYRDFTLLIDNEDVNNSGFTYRHVGNGVYQVRHSRTFTTTFSDAAIRKYMGINSDVPVVVSRIEFYSGDVPFGVSYIPTTTGSVTRNADVISVTGVAGLIGQTEGTIYAEFINTFSSSYNDGVLIRVFADANNEVFGRKEAASNRYTFRWRANSQNTTFTNVNVPDGVNKVALAYKSGDTALFLNGVQIGSTSTDVRAFSVNPTTVALGSNGGAGQFFNDRIRAASIYQTRLPNTTTDGSPSLQSITTL